VQLVSVSSVGGQYVEAPRLRIASALCIALAFLALTSLGNIPLADLGGRTVPLFLSDIAVVAIVVAGGVASLRAASLRLDDVSFAALTFASIGALSAAAAMQTYNLGAFQVAVSLAYLVRWVAYFGLYVVIINFVRERDVAGVWRALEMAMIAFAAFGILQSIFLPDFGPMMHPESQLYSQIDPQGHRLVSTLLEPNIAAAMILIVLLIQVAQIAYGVRVSWWKPSILFVALVLTMSRSGAAGFFVGVLIILCVRGIGKRLLRFGTIATVLFLAALPSVLAFSAQHPRFGVNDRSAMARLLAWDRAIGVWKENPWLGIGFNTYGFVQEARGFERFGSSTYSSEGGLLFVGVLTGVVGLSVYIVMLLLVVRRCRRGWRGVNAPPEGRALCLGAAAATAAIVIHSIFVNSLIVNFVVEELWVVWGLAFVMVNATRERRAE
jgi:hypothetical protein